MNIRSQENNNEKNIYIHRNSVVNTNHVMQTPCHLMGYAQAPGLVSIKKKGAELVLGPLLIPQNPTHKSFCSRVGQMLDRQALLLSHFIFKIKFQALAPFLMEESVYHHELGSGA
jgi:hypothetical protein